MNRRLLAVALSWLLSVTAAALLGWQLRPVLGPPPAQGKAAYGTVHEIEYAPGRREVFVRTPCCPSGTWVFLVDESDSPVTATARGVDGKLVNLHADGTATLTP